MVAAALVAFAAVGLEYRRPPARLVTATTAATNPVAEAAYLQARYDFAQRTPASLARAVAGFGTAIAADPRSAASYAGLGETYLLLREYSDMPDAEAYARARAAAQAAVALDGDLPAAHRVLAFVAFWSGGDIPTARREFARALALAPQDAQTHHWYATALSSNGEAAAALAEIRAARRLDANSTAILADAGLLTYHAGKAAEGLALLHAVIVNHPDESSSHHYLADIALAAGNDATYLAEAARAAELRGDRPAIAAAAAARRGFAAGGHAGLLRALFDARATARGARGSWVPLAAIAALQGNRALALDLLARAQAAHDPVLITLPCWDAFNGLRAEPAYAAIVRRPSLQS